MYVKKMKILSLILSHLCSIPMSPYTAMVTASVKLVRAVVKLCSYKYIFIHIHINTNTHDEYIRSSHTYLTPSSARISASIMIRRVGLKATYYNVVKVSNTCVVCMLRT